jgi:hypothetical protein
MRKFVVLFLALVVYTPVWSQDFTASVAPNLSWTTGSQKQTIWGGSALLSKVHSKNYCDADTMQFGLEATASDTTTTKLGGTPVVLDNNDVRADATTGIFGNSESNSTRHYIGVAADFFGNNSLGVGLQQIYAAEYQYYFVRCDPRPEKELSEKELEEREHRVFASLGFGAGFLSQRLYATPNNLHEAVLPVSAQVSYFMGKAKGKPPKLTWLLLMGYLPVPADMHAYQLSSIASVQIPTRIPWLAVSFSESDLYMNNAPIGHKRNYQNGTASLILYIPQRAKEPSTEQGACYGGDKLARLYCYDDVTVDACTPPNLFRPKGRCSSSGASPLNVPTL